MCLEAFQVFGRKSASLINGVVVLPPKNELLIVPTSLSFHTRVELGAGRSGSHLGGSILALDTAPAVAGVLGQQQGEE